MSGVLIADIRPIINTNCAVPDCHDGSDPSLPDWTDDNALRGFASLIKTRTANREMPPSDANTMLTDEEIELIGCWVDDGAN